MNCESVKRITAVKLISPLEKIYDSDSFIVYPAEDRTPYHSLRLKVFYDGLQDMTHSELWKNMRVSTGALKLSGKTANMT